MSYSQYRRIKKNNWSNNSVVFNKTIEKKEKSTETKQKKNTNGN
jgi:hypothetical protein